MVRILHLTNEEKRELIDLILRSERNGNHIVSKPYRRLKIKNSNWIIGILLLILLVIGLITWVTDTLMSGESINDVVSIIPLALFVLAYVYTFLAKFLNHSDKNDEQKLRTPFMQTENYVINKLTKIGLWKYDNLGNPEVRQVYSQLVFAKLIGKFDDCFGILTKDTKLLVLIDSLNKANELDVSIDTIIDYQHKLTKHLNKSKHEISRYLDPYLDNLALKLVNSNEYGKLLPQTYKERYAKDFLKHAND